MSMRQIWIPSLYRRGPRYLLPIGVEARRKVITEPELETVDRLLVREILQIILGVFRFSLSAT